MRFTKEVIRPGTYRTRQGESVVTPERVGRWHDTLQRLLSAGVKVPLVWGHRREAVPGDEEFLASRYAAGTVVGSSLKPDGTLIIEGDAPGVEVDAEGRAVARAELPSGEKVTTAISDVSIGVRDWVAGDGTLYEDAPIHVALTPIPVAVGTAPFQPSGEVNFSAFSFGAYAGEEVEGQAPKSSEKPAAPEPPAPVPAPATAPAATVEQLITALQRVGVRLPEDTSVENFADRLLTALTALADPAMDPAQGMGQQQGQQGSQQARPAEASESFFGVLGSDPRVKALVERVERDQREKRLGRLQALKARGLPPHLAVTLAGEATLVTFSLADDPSNPATAEIDRRLDLLEAVLPTDPHGLDVEAVPSPEDEGPEQQQQQRHQNAVDELLAAAPFHFTTTGS